MCHWVEVRLNLEHQRKHLQKHNESSKIFKTEEDKQEVIRLYRSGLSCNQIAKKYNCSKYPVLKILKNEPKRNPGDYSQHRSKNQFGENNGSWKGGIKSIYDRVRGLKVYWEWRNSIVERDGKQCTNCKSTEELEVHHNKTLKSLIIDYCSDNDKKIKDLSHQDLTDPHFYENSNGSTLCKTCHRNYHKVNGRS